MKFTLLELIIIKALVINHIGASDTVQQPIPIKLNYVTKYEITGYEWINWQRTEFSYKVYFKPVTQSKIICFIKDVRIAKSTQPTSGIVKQILEKSFKLKPLKSVFLSNSYPSPWQLNDISELKFVYNDLNIFSVNHGVIHRVIANGGESNDPMYGAMFGVHVHCNNNITVINKNQSYYIVKEVFKTRPCQNFNNKRDVDKIGFDLEVESHIMVDNAILEWREIKATQLAQRSPLKIATLSLRFIGIHPEPEFKDKLYSELIPPFEDGLFSVKEMLPFKPGYDLRYKIRLNGNINEDFADRNCDLYLNLREINDPNHVFALITSKNPCQWSKLQQNDKIMEIIDTVTMFGIMEAGLPVYRPLRPNVRPVDLLCYSDFCGIPNSFFIETLAYHKFDNMKTADIIPNENSVHDGCSINHRYNNSTLTSTFTKTCSCFNGFSYKEVTEQMLNPKSYTFLSRRTTVDIDLGIRNTRGDLTEAENNCQTALLSEIVPENEISYVVAQNRIKRLYGQVEVVFETHVKKEINDENRVFNYFGEPINEKLFKRARK